MAPSIPPLLRTWRCPPLLQQTTASTPPFLVYRIGLEGKKLRVFWLVPDAIVGDIYVVQALWCNSSLQGHACSAPRVITRARDERRCVVELDRIPATGGHKPSESIASAPIQPEYMRA